MIEPAISQKQKQPMALPAFGGTNITWKNCGRVPDKQPQPDGMCARNPMARSTRSTLMVVARRCKLAMAGVSQRQKSSTLCEVKKNDVNQERPVRRSSCQRCETFNVSLNDLVEAGVHDLVRPSQFQWRLQCAISDGPLFHRLGPGLLGDTQSGPSKGCPMEIHKCRGFHWCPRTEGDGMCFTSGKPVSPRACRACPGPKGHHSEWDSPLDRRPNMAAPGRSHGKSAKTMSLGLTW